MKLYVYEHCPFCIRARMIFALKNIAFDLGIIMEADVETPTRMIGKKMVPILQKDDGSYMGESLDIVRYVDGMGASILSEPDDARIAEWDQAHHMTIYRLAVPRFTQGDFKELATPEARAYFYAREEKSFGNLQDLLSQSAALIADIDVALQALSPWVEGRGHDAYGMDDITLFPLLYSLSIVKGVTYPEPVLAYMQRLSKASEIPLLFDQAM